MVKSSTLPVLYPGSYHVFQGKQRVHQNMTLPFLSHDVCFNKNNDVFGAHPTYISNVSNTCMVISYSCIFTAASHCKCIETFDMLQKFSVLHIQSVSVLHRCMYIHISLSFDLFYFILSSYNEEITKVILKLFWHCQYFLWNVNPIRKTNTVKVMYVY